MSTVPEVSQRSYNSPPQRGGQNGKGPSPAALVALTAAEARSLLELCRRAVISDTSELDLLARLTLHVLAAERQAVRP